MNEPLLQRTRIIGLVRPHETHFKKIHEPHRKARGGYLHSFKEGKQNRVREKKKKKLAVICGDFVMVGGIDIAGL